MLEKIGEHGRRRGNPPCAESPQRNNGTVAGRDLETIFSTARAGEKIRWGKQAWLDRIAKASLDALSHGQQHPLAGPRVISRAARFLVDARERFAEGRAAEGDSAQNLDLPPRIEPAEIGRRIRLSEALLLRIAQGLRKRHTRRA